MKQKKKSHYEAFVEAPWYEPIDPLDIVLKAPFKSINPQLITTPIKQDPLENRRTRACLKARQYYRLGCSKLKSLALHSGKRKLTDKECEKILTLTAEIEKRFKKIKEG